MHPGPAQPKIYVQSTGGTEYLSRVGKWSADLAEASEYTSSAAAVMHAATLRIGSFTVLMRFADGRRLQIPITPPRQNTQG
jgi:hypothetical protein